MSTYPMEACEAKEAQVLQILSDLESKTYRLTELLAELERRLDAVLKPSSTETCEKSSSPEPDFCPLSINLTAQVIRTKNSMDHVNDLLERLAI